MRRFVIGLVFTLLLTAPLTINYGATLEIQNDGYSANRSTNIDISVTDVSYSYTSTADSDKYKMFSSNYPILNFNRPEQLFVIDAMVNVPIELQITVNNFGTANSGVVSISVMVSHNEISNFEMNNESATINSISGGSSRAVTVEFTPSYSGNHTMYVAATTTQIDDNYANNNLTTTFTVGNQYFNCDDLNGWTVGTLWKSNTDTFLSKNQACHVGNGQFGTYPDSSTSELLMPVMDLSDKVQNPTRTNGLSFYYTGSLVNGDYVKLFGKEETGIWTEISSITGIIDQTFTDGANWQTWSVNNQGHASPIIPIPNQFFHQNSQFKFVFSSDSANNDIGLWIDEIVIVYDQELSVSEYGLEAVGVYSTGTVPDSWGYSRIAVTNTGNITDTYTPQLNNLPQGWDTYFAQTTGVSISQANGILVEPGQTKEFDVYFKPESSANQGMYQVQFELVSKTHQSVLKTLNLQFEVTPDRIPSFLEPLSNPSCAPGTSCAFELYITNIGGASDVFDISLDINNLPDDWVISLAFDQTDKIFVPPGVSVPISMIFTVPSDAIPDSVAIFDIIANSQNETNRQDKLTVNLVASMVSDAQVTTTSVVDDGYWELSPGETKQVIFTVNNFASVQDIFETELIIRDLNGWTISKTLPETLYVNSGKSATFGATFTAPLTAQYEDSSPKFAPKVTSIRSGESFTGPEIDNFRVSKQSDLVILAENTTHMVKPGNENFIPLVVENNGNGADTAVISVDNLPSQWSYRITDNSGVDIQQIPLSAIYNLEDIVEVNLVLIPPQGIDANIEFTISASVSALDGSEDFNLDDNIIELTIITETVRKIALENSTENQFVGVNNYTYMYSNITNLGNVYEPEIYFKSMISTIGYEKDIPYKFTINDYDYEYDTNTLHKLDLEKGETVLMKLEVQIPEDMPIGTRIIAEHIVMFNDNGTDVMHKNDVMWTVDYRRALVMEFGPQETQYIDENMMGRIWINLSSTSTIEEKIILNFNKSDNWEVMCNSYLVGDEGYEITVLKGDPQEQYLSTYCEVIRQGGELDSEVIIFVENHPNFQGEVFANRLIFETNNDESLSFTSPIFVFPTLSLIVVVIIFIIINKRKMNLTDEEIMESKPINGPPISGPPISQTINQPAIIETVYTESAQSPPIPEEGLPAGWTIEQWQYYGQQYLDRIGK